MSLNCMSQGSKRQRTKYCQSKVSKIQEAITMSEYEQIGAAAIDERLQFAKFALEQRRWKSEEQSKVPPVGIDSFEDEEDFKKIMNENTPSAVDPRLQALKEKLKERIDLLQQLTQQEKLFLGAEQEEETSEICDNSLTGTTAKDYYLVPGRRDTFVCKGTKMTLFGQMSNKRWRCWIEIDNLVSSMNSLLPNAEASSDKNNNGETLFDKNKKYLSNLTKEDFENRGYPMIGSVPTSLVEELQNFTSSNCNETNPEEIKTAEEEKDASEKKDASDENGREFVKETPPTSPVLQMKDTSTEEEKSPAPYSSHARRTPRKTNSQLSFDAVFFGGDALSKSPAKENGSNSPRALSGNFGNFRESLFYQRENHDTGAILPSSNRTVAENRRSNLVASYSLPGDREDSPASSANNSPVMPVKLRDGGFVIKKKLRQKGISIIVGSSSSEEESSEEEAQGDDENNDRKSETPKSAKRFSTSDVTETATSEKNIQKRFAARSSSTLPPQKNPSTDLLDQFGLRSASVSGNEDKPKSFPKFKGPDVKPPRNERRTLKLSKSSRRGYGFYLQTYVFPDKTGEKDVKTFVRYVEEEGPAYLAGLREGDVIVEIDGQNAEKKTHAQLVNSIKRSEHELLLVVKFIDAAKRADLCINLKKKRAKLRARVREFEDLVAKESDLLRATNKDASAMERSDSVTSSGIGLSDDSSENLAAINNQVIIQTSRFEEQSSKVVDYVKEVRYNDDGTPNSGNARTHITTASDLLSAYSTTGNLPEKSKKSNPVHRSRSFSGSEKKIDRNSMQPRGRLNSKDDGFITASPSLTKSRPPAKIISNRNSASEYGHREVAATKSLQPKESLFYDPSKDRSSLPVKTRSHGAQSERARALTSNEGALSDMSKTGLLSHSSRDRVLSRNSRAKSYKIAVTTGQGAGCTIVEKVITYEQSKELKAPETDL
ncbi:microtubule-associated serine/threonine-protein kinase 2-like isoform X2 [Rhopilema esculentum]|uniref:microtubule-associated serine/threonine-protein kinase 2-like isoform X2 n=1 Tax=Rhopilema esculentum TaxID=499914 RepID=UPI0031D1642B